GPPIEKGAQRRSTDVKKPRSGGRPPIEFLAAKPVRCCFTHTLRIGGRVYRRQAEITGAEFSRCVRITRDINTHIAAIVRRHHFAPFGSMARAASMRLCTPSDT